MALIRSGNAGSTDSKLFVWDTDFCDGLGFHGRKNEQGKSGKFVQKKIGHFNFTKIMISNGCHPADSWRSCKTKTWFWTKMVLELTIQNILTLQARGSNFAYNNGKLLCEVRFDVGCKITFVIGLKSDPSIGNWMSLGWFWMSAAMFLHSGIRVPFPIARLDLQRQIIRGFSHKNILN